MLSSNTTGLPQLAQLPAPARIGPLVLPNVSIAIPVHNISIVIPGLHLDGTSVLVMYFVTQIVTVVCIFAFVVVHRRYHAGDGLRTIGV